MSTAEHTPLGLRPPVRAELSPVGLARAPDRAFHLVLLLLSLFVITAAWLLEVRGETQVAVRWLNFPLPGVCSFQRLFGIPCPGCGLTRCFVSLAHGELARAWHFNPAGVLLYGLIWVQIPFRGVQLARLQLKRSELQLHPWGSWMLWSLFGLLIAQWVSRGVGLW